MNPLPQQLHGMDKEAEKQPNNGEIFNKSGTRPTRLYACNVANTRESKTKFQNYLIKFNMKLKTKKKAGIDGNIIL